MTAKTAIAALAAGFALAGCVSVLPDAPPPAARYLIEPVVIDGAGGEAVVWSLAVEDPMTTRVYDTPKIALTRAAGRVEYYAQGQWADRAPRLVQVAMIGSFENSGRILSVGDRGVLPLSDFMLQTDIRSLRADYTGGGAPVARFALYARLTDGRGRVFAARLFENEVPAGADSVPAVAAALDSAVGRTIPDVVEWTLREGAAAYTPRRR